MPKIKCSCNEVIQYGEIPSPYEWLLISDVEFDKYSGLIDAEEVYRDMKRLLKCPNCGRLWIFWNDNESPPREYVPSTDLN